MDQVTPHPDRAHRPRPALLCILDGWGHRPERADNAIAQANHPNWTAMMAQCPHGLIDASELHVGLPRGQMGNSEVGHMNLGAGRVVLQDLPRIDKAIADGSLAKNPELQAFIAALRKSGGTAHVMGLLSPGGVHSHQDHLAALARILAKEGVKVAVHAFLDGRDVPPSSAREYLRKFQADIAPTKIATIAGRYYAMDRDKRWERVARAYEALVLGREAPHAAKAADADQAVAQSYAQKITDEFVAPTVLGAYGGIKDGDGLLMGN